MDTRERVSHIKLIAFDIDGVMTDGGLHYTDDGRELKTFNVQDGLGLKLLQRAGLELAIVTGRTSGVVTGRAADLGIAHVFQGVADKRAVVGELLEKLITRTGDPGRVQPNSSRSCTSLRSTKPPNRVGCLVSMESSIRRS